MAPLLALAFNALPSIIGMIDSDSGDKASKVIDVVRTVTGTTDPTEAARVLENPTKMIELQKGLNDVTVSLAQEETKRLEAVNKTMQVEANSKNWWTSGWRPFIGFMVGLAFVFTVIGIFVIVSMAVYMKDATILGHIPTLVGTITALFATPCAILGVSAHHRGKEKRGQ